MRVVAPWLLPLATSGADSVAISIIAAAVRAYNKITFSGTKPSNRKKQRTNVLLVCLRVCLCISCTQNKKNSNNKKKIENENKIKKRRKRNKKPLKVLGLFYFHLCSWL